MKLKLIERRPLFRDVESFIFELEESIDWLPGQYMHYVLPHQDQDGRGQERWFTISAPPYEKHIAITTRFADKQSSSFKRALWAMPVGATIEADGPKGKFIIDQPAKKHILIAGGIGITPYHSMLLELDRAGRLPDIDLLYVNRDNNFVFGHELARLESRHQNFHIHKFIGSRRIEKADLKPYADDPDTIFYVSGPEAMVENYAEMLRGMGLSEDRIKTDFFPGY